MTRLRFPLALLACLAADLASAQALADVPYDGTWAATIQTEAGTRQSTRFVLREFAGYWQAATGVHAVTGRACGGKRLPITVQTSTTESLEFTVWASQISPQCIDLTVVAKPLGEGILEGTVEGVGKIRFTRR